MWQATCLTAIMAAVIIVMVPIFQLLKIFGCLRNNSEFLNHLRSTIALKNVPIKFSMQRIFSQKKEEKVFLKPGSVTNFVQKNFNESFYALTRKSNFSRSQEENLGENEIGISKENIDVFNIKGTFVK